MSSPKHRKIAVVALLFCSIVAIIHYKEIYKSFELLEEPGQWGAGSRHPALGVFEGHGCFQIGALNEPCLPAQKMEMNGKLLVPSDSSIAYQAGVERLQERTLRETIPLVQKRLDYSRKANHGIVCSTA
jgi:hypothetical protein